MCIDGEVEFWIALVDEVEGVVGSMDISPSSFFPSFLLPLTGLFWLSDFGKVILVK